MEQRFAERRRTVLERLDRDAMVLAAGPELVMGRDTEVRYLPDAELFYLTGCQEPGAVAVLAPYHDQPFTLFVRPRDPDAEIWTGPRPEPATAAERFGADAGHALGELQERLPGILDAAAAIHYRPETGRRDLDDIIRDTLRRARSGRQRTGAGPDALVDPGRILDPMRVIKDDAEIAAIRDAIRITLQALRDALDMARPGRGEWEIEAALEAGFRTRGADGFAFPSIVASGPNATTLHYSGNNRRMEDGDLLLVDAGARHRRYNADITRTITVGAVDDAHRAVLDAVDAARHAAIHAVRPGASIHDVHHAAASSLAGAMVELELLDGDPDQIARDDDRLKTYFPHRTSHWLGLDVHDVGAYATNGQPRKLQPGMVLTIEPGLYILPGNERAPAHLRGIGARLEDDVLVTPDGYEVLSHDVS